MERTSSERGRLSFLGKFQTEFGWPSARDVLAAIPASHGVGPDGTWIPFQLCSSMVLLFYCRNKSRTEQAVAWEMTYNEIGQRTRGIPLGNGTDRGSQGPEEHIYICNYSNSDFVSSEMEGGRGPKEGGMAAKIDGVWRISRLN